MATTEDFLKILNSMESITEAGLMHDSKPPDYIEKRKSLENRYDEFNICCEWIKKFRYRPSEKQFRKYVQVQTYNSYYLKHLVEKWSGKYISNGAFIAAIKYLGIPHRTIYGTPDISVTIFLKEKATVL
jgi:hypothetical protein